MARKGTGQPASRYHGSGRYLASNMLTYACLSMNLFANLIGGVSFSFLVAYELLINVYDLVLAVN